MAMKLAEMNAGYLPTTYPNWDDPSKENGTGNNVQGWDLLSIEPLLFHRDTYNISYGSLLKPSRNWVVSQYVYPK